METAQAKDGDDAGLPSTGVLDSLELDSICLSEPELGFRRDTEAVRFFSERDLKTAVSSMPSSTVTSMRDLFANKGAERVWSQDDVRDAKASLFQAFAPLDPGEHNDLSAMTVSVLRFMGLKPLNSPNLFLRHCITALMILAMCVVEVRSGYLTSVDTTGNIGACVSGTWGFISYLIAYHVINTRRLPQKCNRAVSYFTNSLLDTCAEINVTAADSTSLLELLPSRRRLLAHQHDRTQTHAAMVALVVVPFIVWVLFVLSFFFIVPELEADVDPLGLVSTLGLPLYVAAVVVMLVPMFAGVVAPWWLHYLIVRQLLYCLEEHTFWFRQHVRFYLERGGAGPDAADVCRAMRAFWTMRMLQFKEYSVVQRASGFRFAVVGVGLGVLSLTWWFFSEPILFLVRGSNPSDSGSVSLASGWGLTAALVVCAQAGGLYFYYLRSSTYQFLRVRHFVEVLAADPFVSTPPPTQTGSVVQIESVTVDQSINKPTGGDSLTQQPRSASFSISSHLLLRPYARESEIKATPRQILRVLLLLWSHAAPGVVAFVAVVTVRLVTSFPNCATSKGSNLRGDLSGCSSTAIYVAVLEPVLSLGVGLPVLVAYTFHKALPSSLVNRAADYRAAAVAAVFAGARLTAALLTNEYRPWFDWVFAHPSWITVALVYTTHASTQTNSPSFWRVMLAACCLLLVCFGWLVYYVTPLFLLGSEATQVAIVLLVTPLSSIVMRALYLEVVLAFIRFPFVLRSSFVLWSVMQLGLAIFYRMFIFTSRTLSVQALAIIYFAAAEVLVRIGRPLKVMALQRFLRNKPQQAALETASAHCRSRVQASLIGINTLTEFQSMWVGFLLTIVARAYYEKPLDLGGLTVLLVLQSVAELFSDYTAMHFEQTLLERNYLAQWVEEASLFGRVSVVAVLIIGVPVASVALTATL